MIPTGRLGWTWARYWSEQRREIEQALQYRRMGWREHAHSWAKSAGLLRKERMAVHGR